MNCLGAASPLTQLVDFDVARISQCEELDETLEVDPCEGVRLRHATSERIRDTLQWSAETFCIQLFEARCSFDDCLIEELPVKSWRLFEADSYPCHSLRHKAIVHFIGRALSSYTDGCHDCRPDLILQICVSQGLEGDGLVCRCERSF